MDQVFAKINLAPALHGPISWTNQHISPIINVPVYVLYIKVESVKEGVPGSADSIVYDYGLDDREIEVRSPA